MSNGTRKIAVAYLARGADNSFRSSCERFLRSYRRWRPGVAHSLYVIFKGFASADELGEARDLFNIIPHHELFLDDETFDIGAYLEWASRIDEEIICALNTSSEILSEDWLMKLAVNLEFSNVGLVGATGSFESLSELNSMFPGFPNPHLRSNAFMVDRELFCKIGAGNIFGEKLDAYLFESGPKSMTRLIRAMGQEVQIVGSNGRGYSSKWWPSSETFRLGMQGNLLIADNQTRNFSAYRWAEKQEFVFKTWGHFVRELDFINE